MQLLEQRVSHVSCVTRPCVLLSLLGLGRHKRSRSGVLPWPCSIDLLVVVMLFKTGSAPRRFWTQKRVQPSGLELWKVATRTGGPEGRGGRGWGDEERALLRSEDDSCSNTQIGEPFHHVCKPPQLSLSRAAIPREMLCTTNECSAPSFAAWRATCWHALHGGDVRKP